MELKRRTRRAGTDQCQPDLSWSPRRPSCHEKDNALPLSRASLPESHCLHYISRVVVIRRLKTSVAYKTDSQTRV